MNEGFLTKKIFTKEKMKCPFVNVAVLDCCRVQTKKKKKQTMVPTHNSAHCSLSGKSKITPRMVKGEREPLNIKTIFFIKNAITES